MTDNYFKDSKVRYKPSRKKPLRATLSLILPVIVFIAFSTIFLFLPSENESGKAIAPEDIAIISIAFILIAAAIWAFVYIISRIYYKSEGFSIGDEGISYDFTFIVKHFVNLPFERINAVKIKRNLVDLMLKTACIKIESGSGTIARPEISLVLDNNYAEYFKDYLQRKATAVKAGKHLSEQFIPPDIFATTPNQYLADTKADSSAYFPNDSKSSIQTLKTDSKNNTQALKTDLQTDTQIYSTTDTQNSKTGYDDLQNSQGDFAIKFIQSSKSSFDNHSKQTEYVRPIDKILSIFTGDALYIVVIFILSILPIAYFGLKFDATTNQADLPTIMFGITIIVLALIVFIVAAMIIGVFVHYYNYKIYQKDGCLEVSYGLINRNSFSVSLDKIRGITITQGLIGQIFKTGRLRLNVVGLSEQTNEQQKITYLYPFGTIKRINEIIAKFLPQFEYAIKFEHNGIIQQKGKPKRATESANAEYNGILSVNKPEYDGTLPNNKAEYDGTLPNNKAKHCVNKHESIANQNVKIQKAANNAFLHNFIIPAFWTAFVILPFLAFPAVLYNPLILLTIPFIWFFMLVNALMLKRNSCLGITKTRIYARSGGLYRKTVVLLTDSVQEISTFGGFIRRKQGLRTYSIAYRSDGLLGLNRIFVRNLPMVNLDGFM